jgi:hypothetical protein
MSETRARAHFPKCYENVEGILSGNTRICALWRLLQVYLIELIELLAVAATGGRGSTSAAAESWV